MKDAADVHEYPFVRESERRLLRRIDAKSFQGIALEVGDEKLGVLYVNYSLPRNFSEGEKKPPEPMPIMPPLH